MIGAGYKIAVVPNQTESVSAEVLSASADIYCTDGVLYRNGHRGWLYKSPIPSVNG